MTEPTKTPTRKSIKAVLGAIAIVLIGLVLQYSLKNTGVDQTTQEGATKMERISVSPDIGKWSEYTNSKLRMTVKYPERVSLRGTPDSDMAILTLDQAVTDGKQAHITFINKRNPIGRDPYASFEDFWQDESQQLIASSGTIQTNQPIELNKEPYFEAVEDNRINNFMAIHRYVRRETDFFEATLTIEGDVIPLETRQAFNEILSTLSL